MSEYLCKQITLNSIEVSDSSVRLMTSMQLTGIKQMDGFDWKSFDYDNTDPIAGGYRLMVYDFVDGLEKWVEGKLII